MDAPELLANLGQGHLTTVQLTTAVSKRAVYAHQICNLLLEICIDSALEQAKALDKYFGQNNKPIGPLHGLPITLKTQFHIKGVRTSAAYVGWIDTFEDIPSNKHIGDLRFINNMALLHRREAFENSEETSRHLVQIWLSNELRCWKLPRDLRLTWARVFGDNEGERHWDIEPVYMDGKILRIAGSCD
ncbi:hypothetical protein AK830_g152 [Neonectria ditissima]|uniref:Amidase domain-containing protein n=1 Tax=Neonectria ditissima TaxID=78410 RepID=A0A0P7BY74_9HYPO|nr:hypothetical protein AK830_g152 [Neonectria ditissima]